MEHQTNRRQFIKQGLMAAGAAAVASHGGMLLTGCSEKEPVKITIADTGLAFESEPLIRPFGFKGGFMTEIWQTASMLRSTSGNHAVGLCTQNVLWSDEIGRAHV